MIQSALVKTTQTRLEEKEQELNNNALRRLKMGKNVTSTRKAHFKLCLLYALLAYRQVTYCASWKFAHKNVLVQHATCVKNLRCQ